RSIGWSAGGGAIRATGRRSRGARFARLFPPRRAANAARGPRTGTAMRSEPALNQDGDATDTGLRQILQETLGLAGARVAAFGPESGLFGHLPELDSMAVAGLLTEVEDRFGIVIDDDEVDSEMLETYGALLDFVRAKRAET